MKIEMGVFNRVRTLSRNIRELGLVGTLRQRLRKGETGFQILTTEQATETPETEAKAEEVGKKKIRGV